MVSAFSAMRSIMWWRRYDLRGRADHRMVPAMLVVAVLEPELPGLEDPVDQRGELDEVDRFGEILFGAELDGLHGVRDAAPRRS